MKNLLLAGTALLILGSVRADTIRLTTAKSITGHVLSYASMTFEVENADGKIIRYSSASITSIAFETNALPANLEVRNKGKLERTITGYDKGTFSTTDGTGKTEKIPAMLVVNATFGAGSSNAKKIEQISGSDLTKYLAKGKVTIVDFYADWCGPCRSIGPFLEDLAKKDPDVVLRKANVDNCKELAGKCGVNGIPHIMIFDKTGKNIGTVVGANRDGVTQYVNQAKGKS